ncbi:MAG: TonB-dependent receptor [Bacteroidales bacterium]|jgi:TonB-linked SusC/RagA family outer membrane protein|nr:TonB-dependent receptor [Bacteroidales bacterium]
MKVVQLKRIIHHFLRTFCVGLLLCGAVLPAYAQSFTVSGTVSDETGLTMPGVNVFVQGTTSGTATDAEGRFNISVPGEDAVLQFTFVGYTAQSVAVGSQRTFNVTLVEEASELEEVVVIGYGTVRKSDLTGAVSSVSSDRIVAIGSSSVMSALQGATPGVDIQTTSTRPGASFSIKIRGQNSITSGNPLYVVDGVVVSDIDYLNPADIEKVDVLKDASSTAIYGSRGSNGVLIVQTKGASFAKSKLTVSYDGYYGVRSIARIPDFMNGREWIDYRTSMYYDVNQTTGLYSITTPNQTAVTNNSKIVHTALYNESYTDWLKEGTQQGSQQNHYINISGNSKDIAYNLGAGYQNEKGNYLLEEMTRYTFKGSISHNANKYFSSGANFSLSHQLVNTGSQYGYRDLLRMPNVLKPYRDDGTLIGQPGIAAEIQGTGNFTSSSNPLLEIKSGSNETRRFDVMGSMFAALSPIEGLNIKTTFSPRFRRQRGGYYRGVVAGNRTVDEAQTSNTENFDWTWDNVVNFNKRFAQKHNVNVTLIHSLYKTQTETLAVTAQNFPYDAQWYNIFNGTLVSTGTSSGYSQTSMISYAARANYDYAGKYMVTGTIRYDGSSKLSEKWAAFPSAAVAWRISEESFLDQVDWLSNLKARLSFGYSGNNNGVGAYGTQVTPSTGSLVYYDFGGTMVSGYGTGLPVNTSLTWEKTREWNFGIDFGVLRGRINGSVDLYDKLSDGLLMNRTLTIESGVASMRDNIGSVNNRGVEVALNTVNVQTRDLVWTTTFIFAYNKNAIRSLYGKKEDVVGESRFIGEPINVIYSYQVDGVYNKAEWEAMDATTRTKMGVLYPGVARAIDTNGDGEMTTDDRIILGQVDPKWTGSISSTLNFKGFDFSFNIYTRQGSFVSDAFLGEYGVAGNNQRGRPKVKQDYYIPEGVARFDWTQPFTTDSDGQHWAVWGTSQETPNAKYPLSGKTGNYYGGNGTYQKVSFVKVRNITLGYTFPQNWVSKIKLASARLYVNVLNPFTFTDYVGWDPEYATTVLQNGNGPSTITYQVGVNVKF